MDIYEAPLLHCIQKSYANPVFSLSSLMPSVFHLLYALAKEFSIGSFTGGLYRRSGNYSTQDVAAREHECIDCHFSRVNLKAAK